MELPMPPNSSIVISRVDCVLLKVSGRNERRKMRVHRACERGEKRTDHKRHDLCICAR